VAPTVAGSIPVSHPNNSFETSSSDLREWLGEFAHCGSFLPHIGR
jgi:hypothetical protein